MLGRLSLGSDIFSPGPEKVRSASDLLPWLIVGAGLLTMYVPTFVDLFRSIWSSEEQAHGPIVLGVVLWLLQRKWSTVYGRPIEGGRPYTGGAVLFVGGVLYALGRSQEILLFEVGSLIWVVAGVILMLRGAKALTDIWFALFFMLFMIPLPGTLVDQVTQPMKLAVSYVAEQILFQLGYPVARNGVVIQIGPYQLLVADACAGLHTLFALEALGLLYLNVVRYSSGIRNTILALLVVPISFSANVVRVMTLTLITYYWGDAAGQGFLHGFSGMVLFLSALGLILGADSLVRYGLEKMRRAPARG
jgi:exosortase B